MSRENRPRRRDRGQDDGWIRAFLHSSPFCALASVSEGQPFINTNIYAYDEERHAIVEDDDEKSQALQLVLDKYAPHLRPGNDYRPMTRDERDRTSVFRIEIDSWSGKKKEAEPDFPRAFLYANHD